jgi:2-oxoisovalerate dehydrogenase E1 component
VALQAAEILESKYGLSAEIIDARSMVPFDYTLVLQSLKKTGRIVLTSDATSRGSFLKEMAQTITELAFDDLDAPPVVVGSRNWITPAYELEKYFFPQPEWILDAIHTKIIPLDSYQAENDFTEQTQIGRNRDGI